MIYWIALSRDEDGADVGIVERRSNVSLRRTRGTCGDQLQLPRLELNVLDVVSHLERLCRGTVAIVEINPNL